MRHPEDRAYSPARRGIWSGATPPSDPYHSEAYRAGLYTPRILVAHPLNPSGLRIEATMLEATPYEAALLVEIVLTRRARRNLIGTPTPKQIHQN